MPTLLGLLLLGFGFSLSNTREAIKALFTNRIWEFNRTPKYADLHNKEEWRLKRYQIRSDKFWILELIFAMTGLWAIGVAIQNQNFSVLFILVPFTISYGFVLLSAILQSQKANA